MKFVKFKHSLSVILAIGVICLNLCSCTDSKDNKNSVSQSDSTSAVTTTEPADSSSATSESSSQAEKKPADITPAMWEVTDKNGTKMTLMGSMHALTENDYPLPEKITNAYNKADVLAVECDPSDISLNDQSALYNNMKLADGKTIKDELSEKGYKGLVNEAKLLGVNIKVLENMKPWAVQNTIDAILTQKAGLDANKGIDTYFLGQAKNTNKEVYQVESAKFQMNLIMNASDTIYDIQFMSAESSSTLDDLTKSTKELYKYWRTGDTEKMQKLLEGEDDVKALNLSESQMKELEAYNDDMLFNRNKNMEKAIKELLSKKKNVFYIVGLAHFLGEGGILDLLEKDGYTVTQIKY